MKILIIANNQSKWNWDNKIQALKDWFPFLEVRLVHTQFKNIPFTPFDEKNNEVDRMWYDQNIHPLVKGEAITLFSIPIKEWKGGGITGRWTYDSLTQEIQISSNETGIYYFGEKKYPGDRWFHLARHEISHALYKLTGLYDMTHFYWELGQFEKSRDELMKVIKPTMKYKYFTESEVKGLKPELVEKLDIMREYCGFPFKINSGLRTKEENDKLKDSASNSGHLRGFEADIACTDSAKRDKILEASFKFGITRRGVGKTFIHLGVDPSLPQNVTWHYY